MIYQKFASKVILFVSLFFSITLMADLHTGLSVFAQAGTEVRFTPEESRVNAGNTAALSLEVIAGENVNAFDFTITYDPAVLALDSYTLGTYLSNLAEIKKEVQPGLFRLVCTQLATPAVSGDGILIQFVFRGVTEGQSPITLEALQFADSNGKLVEPTRSNGLIYVLPQSDPTATPTLTSAPINTLPLPSQTPDQAQTLAASATNTPAIVPTATQLALLPTRQVASATQTPSHTTTPLSPAATSLNSSASGQPGALPVPSNAEHQITASPKRSLTPAVTALPDSQLVGFGTGSNLFTDQVKEQILWGILMLCVVVSIFLLAVLVVRRHKRKLQKKENQL